MQALWLVTLVIQPRVTSQGEAPAHQTFAAEKGEVLPQFPAVVRASVQPSAADLSGQPESPAVRRNIENVSTLVPQGAPVEGMPADPLAPETPDVWELLEQEATQVEASATLRDDSASSGRRVELPVQSEQLQPTLIASADPSQVLAGQPEVGGEAPASAAQTEVAEEASVSEPTDEPSEDERKAARAAFARGATLFSEGDLNGARKAYAETLEVYPEHPAALTNYGLTLHRLGELDDAALALEKAVRKVPDSIPANMLLGLVYVDKGEHLSAIARLSLAASLDPENPELHNHLGVALVARGWNDGAESSFRRAIELDSSFAEAHFNLALMYLERNPPAVELARRHYREALDFGEAPDEEIENKLAAANRDL